ncbi:hypothetical protein BH20ACT11_BH20ACT11_16460 [soil metagenome]
MDYSRRVGSIEEGPPYWLLARCSDTKRRGRSRTEGLYDILTAGPERERVLPLFGSEAAAVSFLGCLASDGRQVGWRATEAGAGELLTMLSAGEGHAGPCAGVQEIAFDPPEALVEERNPGIPTVGRRVFMDRLLGRGGRWSGAR